MKIILYTVLICIMLGFVTVTDDAVRIHQSLVRWSCVRADTICIIHSMLHKCVLALVTPRGPKVLSLGAWRAPPCEGLHRFGRQLEIAAVAEEGKDQFPCSLQVFHNVTETLDVGEDSWVSPALSSAFVSLFPTS